MAKFGVYLPQVNAKYSAIEIVALQCERLGFESVWYPDHMIPGGNPKDSFLECWTLLSALARATTRLRLGSYVLCNSFRYPSIVAKMASTLDVISNGRLELGMGAGWYEPEYLAYGIPFPKASTRIEQLREGLQIIKKMWTEEKPTFQGKYYSIRKAINNPKPIQKPHPPIWVGVMTGEKLMLKTVAEFADCWTIASICFPSLDDYKRKVEILKRHCRIVGRKPGDIQSGLGAVCLIAENQRELEDKIKRFKPKELSVREYLEKKIVGTPEQCIEKIERYVRAGVTCFALNFPDVVEIESVKIFSKHVIPAFKGEARTTL